jgi:hypothetical protein
MKNLYHVMKILFVFEIHKGLRSRPLDIGEWFWLGYFVDQLVISFFPSSLASRWT